MRVMFLCQDVGYSEYIMLALKLRWPDINAQIASRGDTAVHAVEREQPDLVILCHDLPGLRIWQAIKEIRLFSDVPIVLVVQVGDDTDVVKAVDLGADEYITIPCSLPVLMARIVALMRRAGFARQHTEAQIRCGSLTIDASMREVFVGDKRITLTPTEFRLLHLLAQNKNVTLSQEFIQRMVWSDDEVGNSLKKYIQRLRRKLGESAQDPMWIKTVHGFGYRFSTGIANAPQVELSSAVESRVATL